MAKPFKSEVWQFFDRTNAEACTCRVCKFEVKKPKGNTSNLTRHLERHHQREYQEYNRLTKLREEEEKQQAQQPKRKQIFQPTLSESFKQATPYASNDAKMQKLNGLLVNTICKEGLPLNIVDSKPLQMFVSALDPRYKLPTRQAMSSDMIPARYEAVKRTVVDHIAKSGSNASFTTDTWTSSAGDSYSAVTLHYIDESYNYVNRCIAVRHAPGSHTADLLAAHVTEVLQDFGIRTSDSETNCHVTTDNGANIKKAMTKIMKNVKWRGCFAHTLQLVVNAGLDSKEVSGISRTLAKARVIVGHFRRSTSAATLLHDIQVRHNITQHKLLQDVPTRWNSQLTMLDRLIEQRTAVTLALSESRGNVPTNLTAHEWSTASDIVIALKPFLDATVIMSASRYPTLSMTISILDEIKETLQNAEGGLDILRQIFLQQIGEKFGDYMADEELCIATTVDPRYKLLYFTETTKKAQVTKWVLNAMEQVHMSSLPSDATNTTSSASTVAAAETGLKLSKLERLKALEYQAGSSSHNSTANGQIQDRMRLEFSSYVIEQTINSRDDPLKWWRENHLRFPYVAVVARQLLGVPATSVASERAFSKAGDIITKKRNRLGPSKAEKILFLMENE